MKTTIILLLVLGTAFGFPGKDLSEKEFEDKFGIKYETKDMEDKAAEFLKDEEKEIDDNNEKYDKGEANFMEELNELDDEDEKDIVEENMGVPMGEDKVRYFGAINDPIGENTLEELADLEEVYRDFDSRALPSSFDASALGLVTSIKSQGACASCSAFATVAAIETCLLKAGAPKTSLDIAEQQLVDCAYGYEDAGGCNGAWIRSYPMYIAGKELIHENSYPYEAGDSKHKCKVTTYWNPGAKVADKVVKYEATDEEIMFLIQKYGSVVTSLCAGSKAFNNYKKGVYDTCAYVPGKNQCENNGMHAVQLVGWGTENGIDYWKLKNSWGAGWGDHGMMKIKRGTCGVNYVNAALDCKANGSQAAIPKKTGEGARPPCNVNSWWPNLTGTYYLTNYGPTDGKYRRVLSKCQHGLCSPINVKGGNACQIICGATKCGY